MYILLRTHIHVEFVSLTVKIDVNDVYIIIMCKYQSNDYKGARYFCSKFLESEFVIIEKKTCKFLEIILYKKKKP